MTTQQTKQADRVSRPFHSQQPKVSISGAPIGPLKELTLKAPEKVFAFRTRSALTSTGTNAVQPAAPINFAAAKRTQTRSNA